MPDLSYFRLGVNPEAEAPRVKRLYVNSGVDQLVVAEFSETVEAYRKLPPQAIAGRIKAKYNGQQDKAFGFIAVDPDEYDIGMSISGAKDIQMPGDEAKIIKGVNVSAWLLLPYRSLGHGNQVIAHATEQALLRTQNPRLPAWAGRQVWTSILPDNTASIKACQAAGFEEVGPQVESPERLMFFHPGNPS